MWTKMKLVFLMVIMVLVGCRGPKTIAATEAQTKALEAMVHEKHFSIESNQAFPMVSTGLVSLSNRGIIAPGNSASNISLIGNANYVKVYKDSVDIALPYFGERQLPGGYNNRSIGFEFKGVPKDFNIIKDEKTQGYQIKFSFQNKNSIEACDVRIKLYPNLSTKIDINSSHRTFISYRGTVSKENEKD